MGCSPRTDSHRRLDPHGARLVNDRMGLSDNLHDFVPAALCWFANVSEIHKTPGQAATTETRNDPRRTNRRPGRVHRMTHPAGLEYLLNLGDFPRYRDVSGPDLEKMVCQLDSARHGEVGSYRNEAEVHIAHGRSRELRVIRGAHLVSGL